MKKLVIFSLLISISPSLYSAGPAQPATMTPQQYLQNVQAQQLIRIATEVKQLDTRRQELTTHITPEIKKTIETESKKISSEYELKKIAIQKRLLKKIAEKREQALLECDKNSANCTTKLKELREFIEEKNKSCESMENQLDIEMTIAINDTLSEKYPKEYPMYNEANNIELHLIKISSFSSNQ